MPSDASAQLRVIAAKLKVHSNGRALKLKMTRNMRAAASPLVTATKDAAMLKLPSGGGLNALVASEKVTVSILTGPRTAGVRMKTTAPSTGMTDKGFVRHPIYGHRGKGQWRTQAIPQAAGWWSDTLARKSHTVTPYIVAAMYEVALEIEGG